MPISLRIAAASVNQTIYDFPRNVANILAAVAGAKADGAAVLCLEELTLTGYAADDFHHWFRNEVAWPLIQQIAEAAAGMVVSLGCPWRVGAAKKPYNCQFFLANGKVAAISAKSILSDGAAEYESHHFTLWPREAGVVSLTLPDGTVVPFGKPVVGLEVAPNMHLTLFHEQCAEAWPGIHDDGTLDETLAQSRLLAWKMQSHDISLCINPSASKPQPEINKPRLRREHIVRRGTQLTNGGYVYVNTLGSNSGTYAAEGGQIFGLSGQILHESERYSFAPMQYSSVVMELPQAQRGEADCCVSIAPNCQRGGGASRGGERSEGEYPSLHQDYVLSLALWLRDYLAKQRWQPEGYVISLSGGKDSAFAAVLVWAMHVLENNKTALPLTCLYSATASSSARTEANARDLAAALGAEFIRVEAEPVVAAYKTSYHDATGVDLRWENPAHDLALQNLQARVRQPFPWLVANLQKKIPLVTGNQSEAVLGYATFGGDLHLGGVNPIGGIPKTRLSECLQLLERGALCGLPPLPALAAINAETPSAELRPGGSQSDEADLGFTYAQADWLSQHLLIARLPLAEMFAKMASAALFPATPIERRDLLARFLHRFEASQFKRAAAPHSPYIGSNVDPQQSLRTTLLGSPFRAELALLTLAILQPDASPETQRRALTDEAFQEGLVAVPPVFLPLTT